MLSTSLLVLVAGAVVGTGGLGIVELKPEDPIESRVADLALFTVLFADGQRLSVKALSHAWRLSGRALLFGMPMTFLGVALLAFAFGELSWTAALLVGAILSPTDPVFASAIVGRSDVPRQLRQLLNVESGVNDGLALPVVVILIGVLGDDVTHYGALAAELVGGIALGIALPALTAALTRLKLFGAEPRLQALGPVALGVILYGLTDLVHANSYLAAFAAGSTIATLMPEASRAFEELGELLSELTKLVALLLFGALLTPELFERLPLGAFAVAILSLVLVRPVALLTSLAWSPLPRKERLAAAWFGPKGFASVVYALLALQSGIPEAQQVFDLVALCIALSIAVHSSTDVPVAKAFRTEEVDDVLLASSGAGIPRAAPRRDADDEG